MLACRGKHATSQSKETHSMGEMKMLKRNIAIFLLPILLGLELCISNVAFAQNQDGDYYYGTLPLLPDGTYLAAEWQVITPSGLNCRSGPGTQYDIVKVLRKGETFKIPTTEGRNANVDPTKLDDHDLPWFRVEGAQVQRGRPGEVVCLVRASSKYIEPTIAASMLAIRYPSNATVPQGEEIVFSGISDDKVVMVKLSIEADDSRRLGDVIDATLVQQGKWSISSYNSDFIHNLNVGIYSFRVAGFDALDRYVAEDRVTVKIQ